MEFAFEAATDLNRTNIEFSALVGYMQLASVVTRTRLRPNAMKVVSTYRTSMIKRARGFSQYIEEIIHLSRDQETTRLLLEARDLFRSSVELLDRLQVSESTSN